MNPLFTIIVVILIVLAIIDLVVGVSNDAVNFLNSALGSKVASIKTILIIASVGILIGVVTSNGMMEVARKGVFYPEMFTFSDIMMLFVGMMMADVILLNTFNSLGLPTSTTVSLVFELLGSAVAIALFKIWSDENLTILDLGNFINSGKALVIISGILISVVLSFAAGALIMYISRLIFTFRYQKSLSRYGAVWCAISLTGIIYFALLKGIKGSGLISQDILCFVNDNLAYLLLCVLALLSVVLLCLQKLKINILKITILAGTLSLALAFAGNDLVNFIGVPIAGVESYFLAANSGSDTMMMGELAKPAHVDTWILVLAGAIMCITLFFSKSAFKVAATSINLSSQNDEEERFGSSLPSRAIVRIAITFNAFIKRILPQTVVNKINDRFAPLTDKEKGKDATSYDNIRAVVNLSAASILICIGTSLKLPLSTTYVVFMVAMGTSLVDRAWGRESAVYRITGVMVVIMGWFVTALAGFVLSLAIGLFLMWGQFYSLIALALICGYVLCYNLIFKPKKKDREEKPIFKENADETDVLYSCTEYVCETMEHVTKIYNHMLVALFTENRKALKETVDQSEALYQEAHDRKYKISKTLKELIDQNIETGHFYVQVVDYLDEVTKALLHCTRPAFEHIDNNHKGFTEDQIIDLKKVNDGVDNIFMHINNMIRNKDFSSIDNIMEMREALFDTIANSIKNQIKRLKEKPMSTKASALYLNILNETKIMVLQSRNLLKSQAYFLNEINTYQEK